MEVGKSIEAISQKGGQKMGEITFPLWIYLPFAHCRHEFKEEIGNQAAINSQVLGSSLPAPHPTPSVLVPEV